MQHHCSTCPKILLVDDNEMNLFALKMILDKLGNYSSDYALNGKEAVKMIKEKYADVSCECRYQLVFMDINMPVMNGFKAQKKILKM